MIDPPAGGKSRHRECNTAGIRTIMITGDHVMTARNCKGTRHTGDDSEEITGAELANLTDEQLYENIGKYRVYARYRRPTKSG